MRAVSSRYTKITMNTKLKAWLWRGLAIAGALAIILVILGVAALALTGRVWNRWFGMGDMMSGGVSEPMMGVAVSRDADTYGAHDYGEEAMMEKMMGDVMYPTLPIEPPYINDGVAPEATDRAIVRTGSLSLIVKSIDETVANVRTTLQELKGFEAGANFYENGNGTKSGTMTVRVPADRFYEAWDAFKGEAERVERESVSADDVTSQLVDLEARLENHQARETRYRELLSAAKNVEEILKVQDKLDSERLEIERLQAQIKNLSEQATYSTITINLVSEAEVRVLGYTWSPLKTIKQAGADLWAGLTELADRLIRFVILLPIILLNLALYVGIVVLVVFLGWKAVFALKRRLFAEPISRKTNRKV